MSRRAVVGQWNNAESTALAEATCYAELADAFARGDLVRLDGVVRARVFEKALWAHYADAVARENRTVAAMRDESLPTVYRLRQTAFRGIAARIIGPWRRSQHFGGYFDSAPRPVEYSTAQRPAWP
jgi:hypothetical protein